MKLAEALSKQSRDRLELIAADADINPSSLSSPLLVGRLESALLSPSRVEYGLVRRRPPVLSLMGLLLERELRVAEEEARALALRHCDSLCQRLRSGAIVDSEELSLYRRVLSEAWRSDGAVDLSEARILGILRRELGLRQVEHFICAHHRDLLHYWKRDDAFQTLLESLEVVGLLFRIGGDLVLPADLEVPVRDALGIHARFEPTSRLIQRLDARDLSEALRSVGLNRSGSKWDKTVRLLDHMVSPREVLSVVHIHDLRDLAEECGAHKSGSKEDLIRRVVDHFNADGDLLVDEGDAKQDRPIEPKILARTEFSRLFGALRGAELAAILWKHRELRQSGSNATRIETLWASRFSEPSLLDALDGRSLVRLLRRLDLKVSGSKTARIGRLIDAHQHAREGSGGALPAANATTISDQAAPKASDGPPRLRR